MKKVRQKKGSVSPEDVGAPFPAAALTGPRTSFFGWLFYAGKKLCMEYYVILYASIDKNIIHPYY